MPENLKNNTESEFHRQRTAFVILECGILTAGGGFGGSHFNLLCRSGFNEDQALRLIAGKPRGYALNGNVCLCQGTDFSCLSDENAKKAEKYVPFFRKNRWLSETGKIYDGMQAVKTGSVWTPVKEFKISL